MTDFENVFKDAFENDTPVEATEQLDKRQFLIYAKLSGKTTWTVKRLNKASDSTIDKLYSEFNANEVQHKAENTGKAVSKHIVNLYSTSISRVLKIDDIDQLQRDIDNDPIIKDIGFLLVGTFGRFLAPLLVAAHTANHAKGFVIENLEVTINKDES